MMMHYQMFKRLILLGAILALCVVVLGAYVRLSDAGLGCPDWPGCYGTLTVPESKAAIANAQISYPESVIEVGKAWKEMAHRYLAGTLGLIVFGIAVISWKMRKRVSIFVPTILLILIIFQALLGMWTVTLLLKPVIVTAHLIGGMSTLALLTWLAHRHYGYSSGSIISYPNTALSIRFGLVILFIQIFLGGWTSSNYAALACTDFPTCHGAWWPQMQIEEGFSFFRNLGKNSNGETISLAALTTIQWVHRLGALVTFLYLGFLSISLFKYWQLQRLTIILIVLLSIQISLGIANLLLHLPLVLAVGHNLVAALLVIVMVLINSKVTGKIYNKYRLKRVD